MLLSRICQRYYYHYPEKGCPGNMSNTRSNAAAASWLEAMDKYPKFIAYETVGRHTLYPMIKAIFIDAKASVIEVTLLSQTPLCFEIVKNGTVREAAYYPENLGFDGNIYLQFLTMAKRLASK